MTLDIWLIYSGMVLTFMVTPGPSHLLMLSNSIQYGVNRCLATAFGDLSANFLQMLAAAFGLAVLLQGSQDYFVYVKWVGVAYLVYIGLKQFFSRQQLLNQSEAESRSFMSLYMQGFITSAANPKAVIFFAALFPQFIDQNQPLTMQFIILCFTYLFIDGCFLFFYGKFADYFSRKLGSRLNQYFNKISGSLFIAAAVMLGLKDVR